MHSVSCSCYNQVLLSSSMAELVLEEEDAQRFQGDHRLTISGCDDARKKPNHDEDDYGDKWVGLEDGGDDISNTTSTNSLDNSCTSNGSTSSSDMVDDASSCSSSNSSGPLFELSELIAQLPIKRGLSKFYQGKSQSFTSLSRVGSIEDLPKKETPYRRKMKASTSYGNGLDAYKPYTLPKPTIAKKVSRSYNVSSLSFPGRRGSFFSSSRPPLVPVQKKF